MQEGGPFPSWWTDDNKRAFCERVADYHVRREELMKPVRELLELWRDAKVTF